MPRRSTGCEKCRQRKVKCDEARPHCRRCTNYGVQCPGYRPPLGQDLHFVDQTKRTVHRSQSEFALKHPILSGLPQDGQPARFQWHPQPPDQPIAYNVAGHGALRDMHQNASLGTFLDMQSPIKRNQSATTSFAYETRLPAVDMSTSLLEVTINGICGSEFQAMYQDEDQIKPPSHYNMVPSSSSSHTNQDTIQAAIMLLAMCKLLDNFLGDKQARMREVFSGSAFMHPTNEQDTYECRSAWHWYQNIRHTSISMGLVKRQTVFIGGPEWLAITKDAAREDSYVDLLNVLAPLPGLLERIDAITWPEPTLEDLATLCKEICWIKKELDEWHYWRHIAPGKDLFTLMDSRDMTVFISHFPNTIYRTVYQFSSAQTCNQYQLFWLAQMLLDSSFLDIVAKSRLSNHARGLRFGSFTKRTEEDIKRNAYVSANHYCRSIPFICTNGMASIGPVDLLLITTAQRYFQHSGHSRESEWCTRMHKILQSNSATLPAPGMLNNLQFASSQENLYAWEPSMHNTGPGNAPLASFPHQEYYLGDSSFPFSSTYLDNVGSSGDADCWFNDQGFSVYSDSEPIETMPMVGWYSDELQLSNAWKSGADYSQCGSTENTSAMNFTEPINRFDSSSPDSDYMTLQSTQGDTMACQQDWGNDVHQPRFITTRLGF